MEPPVAAGILVLPQRMPARDANGRAVVGYIRVYANQTTTPVTVYTTSALNVAHSQPITSDDAGVFPIIWYDGAAVTMAYEGADGTTQTVDGVTASTSAIAAALQAYSGAVSYTLDTTTTTDADPGAGKMKFNHATPASATYIYFDNLDADGNDNTAWLDHLDDSNTGTDRGRIIIRSQADANALAFYRISGAVVDGTGYRKVPVVCIAATTFPDEDAVIVGFTPSGPTGLAATVTAGTATALTSTASPTVTNSGTPEAAEFDFGIPAAAPPGKPYTFSTDTGDADPGAGTFRFDNATPASITYIYIDNADAAGNTQTAWLDSFDDSTNTAIKGELTFYQRTSNVSMTLNVTGSVTDGTGYRKVAVTHVSGLTLFTDGAELGVLFSRAGNKGADGLDGTMTGPVSSTNNAIALWDGTDGTTVKDGPLIGTGASQVVQLDGSAKLPAVDGSQLTNIGQIVRDPRTSNTKLVAADKGQLIDVTTASFTQTFDPAATLGAGWFVYILNSSATDLTLDADGTETFGAVNAATTAVLKPGQGTIVTSNGSNLYFADQPTGFRNMEIFTASGSFTPKPGVTRYLIRMKGGGGGGRGEAATNTAAGGSEAGEVFGFVDITAAQTVTIGAGGAGGTSANGSNGGNSTFGALATANGGVGGQASPNISAGGSGTFTGGFVENGLPNLTGNGFGTFMTGAGRGGGATAGAPGVNGAGGAGQQSGTAAGAGGDGFCIVMW